MRAVISREDAETYDLTSSVHRLSFTENDVTGQAVQRINQQIEIEQTF